MQSQQVASSRLRAIETGRWVLQVAPTGFSAVVNPDGEVLARTGVSEQATLIADVATRSGETWALRVGPWPVLALAAAAAGGAAVAAGAEGAAGRRRTGPPLRVLGDPGAGARPGGPAWRRRPDRR